MLVELKILNVHVFARLDIFCRQADFVAVPVNTLARRNRAQRHFMTRWNRGARQYCYAPCLHALPLRQRQARNCDIILGIQQDYSIRRGGRALNFN